MCSGYTVDGFFTPGNRIAGLDWDYYSFWLIEAGTISVDLDSPTDQGVQLILYYEVAGNEVGRAISQPFTISVQGQPGLYYILVFMDANFPSNQAYTLSVTSP